MSNLVIVAIPEEQDRVWKISSEQVPHMTLLFLGDADSNPDTQQIIDFVEHAVVQSEHGQFYAEVDHRGVLGPDEADVLFFRQRGHCLRWISQFREQLLQEPHIKTAFDSTDQYDEWQPHLTLGYPTAPAKEDKEDYPFYSVCFDRIAVWDQDFAGPEFRLEWPDRLIEGPAALAYSEMQKAAVVHYGGYEATVAHFDSKGMSWGAKKTTTVESSTTEEPVSQTAELGKKFVEHASVLDNPTLAEQIKAKVQSILDDVTGDADGDVALFGDPLVRAKIQSVLEDFYKDPNVDNAVVYDALGEVFLSHWGVKGMKWGVRRDRTSASPVTSKSSHTLFRGRAKVDTQGGQHHPAHGDAIKVAEALQKMKKSGTAALSNKELQDVATRRNLENQVAVLTSHKGKKFVTNQLHEEGKNIARRGIRVGVTKGLKRAGKVGAAAALA